MAQPNVVTKEVKTEVPNVVPTTAAVPTVPVTTETKKTLDPKLVAHVKTLTSMSARIRYLDSQKMTRGDIARFLSETTGTKVIYQWVRNVLITPIKSAK